MKRWLEQHAKSLGAAAAVVTMLAAVVALIGVKVQIDASARQAREQSARDIYREFLNLSIARPELADPDYCAITGSAQEVAYENYLEYALYTAEQLGTVSSEWDATMLDHLTAHRAALCAGGDWQDDSAGVRRLITQFRAKECKQPIEPCAE
jgi:hypothetical protein